MPDDIQTQLPDNVLDFFSDVEAVRFAERFVKSYGLTEEDVPGVMNLAEDVVYGDVALDKLPSEIVERFHVDAAKSKQAAIEIANARLLPIKESVPGIAQQIRAWGGDVKLEALSESAPLTPELFVQTSLRDILEEMPAHLQGRFAHILELYVSKHSDRALTADIMTRSEKVAGLEFEPEDAKRVLDYVDEKMKGVKIEEEKERRKEEKNIIETKPVAVVKPKKTIEKAEGAEKVEKADGMEKAMGKTELSVGVPLVGTHATASEIPVGTGRDLSVVTDIPLPVKMVLPVPVKPNMQMRERSLAPLGMTHETQKEDAHEIEQVKTVKQVAMETPIAAPATLDEMVGQICSLEPMQLPDGTLADRCKQIVESRFHEVRTASDTQKQLERSVEAGGLGVSGRKLADMTQAIENAFDVFMKHATEKVAQDKMAYLEKQQAEQLQKQTLSEKEEKMMTKRYVELTGKMPDTHVTPVAPSSARVSAGVSQSEVLATKEQNINTDKVRNVIEATKKQVQDLSPSLSLPAGRQGSERRGGLEQSGRPSVQDVKFVKRLSGPIDELGGMTLVDFRRMAKNADQAVEKMSELVRLVEEQGYDKHVEAVRSWQSSPLYQQYLAIARAAMQEGKPLEETRSILAKTSDTLTKEELAAILKLNSELRF